MFAKPHNDTNDAAQNTNGKRKMRNVCTHWHWHCHSIYSYLFVRFWSSPGYARADYVVGICECAVKYANSPCARRVYKCTRAAYRVHLVIDTGVRLSYKTKSGRSVNFSHIDFFEAHHSTLEVFCKCAKYPSVCRRHTHTLTWKSRFCVLCCFVLFLVGSFNRHWNCMKTC